MYDEGQVKANRPFRLSLERLHLFGSTAIVPIKVNAHFANRHIGMVGCPQRLFHTVEQVRRMVGQVRRVKSEHGETHSRMRCTKVKYRLPRVCRNIGQQQHIHSSLKSTNYNCRAVFIKLFAVDVGMGINHV